MKVEQLFHRKGFESFVDSASVPGFTDSANGVVLARNLTHVDPRVFEKKYPELAFMGSGVEVNNTGGYAARIQSLRLIEEGTYRDAQDMSGNGGKISLAGEDNDILVTERTAESKWSDTDIEQARLQNVNLPQRYVATHSKVYMREIDEIGLRGKGNATPGLLNYTGYTTNSASGVIATLTSQQMYDEFASFITDQHNSVNNTPEYMMSVIMTPTRVMNVLAATMMDTANGFATVMNALMTNFKVKFMGTFRGENVGGTDSGTIGANSATVGVSTNSDALVMRIPLPMKMGSIEKDGSFDFKVSSKYRVAGVDFLEDTAGRILTGL